MSTNTFSERPAARGAIALVALLAGLGGGVALDATRDRFDVVPPTFQNPTDEQAALFNTQRQAALRWSVAASTGIAGALMSGIFGLGVGLARGLIVRGAMGLLVGLVAGAIMVGWAGMGGQQYYAIVASSTAQPGVLEGLVIQLTFWLPVSVAISLACATSLQLRPAILNGVSLLVGSGVAAAAVPVGSLVLFLITETNSRDAIPPDTLGHSLMMSMIGSVVMAIFLWLTIQSSKTTAEVTALVENEQRV